MQDAYKYTFGTWRKWMVSGPDKARLFDVSDKLLAIYTRNVLDASPRIRMSLPSSDVLDQNQRQSKQRRLHCRWMKFTSTRTYIRYCNAAQREWHECLFPNRRTIYSPLLSPTARIYGWGQKSDLLSILGPGHTEGPQGKIGITHRVTIGKWRISYLI